MPKDHYLPASLIGRFSTDNTVSARQRSVYILRKGRTSAFQTKAENIAYVNDLYRVPRSPIWGGTPTSVDPELHGYEPALPSALDLLEQAAPVDLATWLRTLVPYVASIFVRGRDFIPRFMYRASVASSGSLNTADNANGARFIELERLLSPVCCARWVVLHKNTREPFVLNDLALTGTVDAITGEHGWATPIGKHSVLEIFPKQKRSVARYEADAWWAIIENRSLDGIEATALNDATAHLATSYVIGSDRAGIERLASIVGKHSNASALMDSWPIDYKARVAHARDWHRLVTVTAGNPSPDNLNDLQTVDAKALAMGWCPPVGLIMNMQEFPTGLSRSGNVIRLTLDTPPDYQAYFIRPEAEQSLG